MPEVAPRDGDACRPGELLRLEPEGRFELVDGRLLALPSKGAEANLIGIALLGTMASTSSRRGLGTCLGPGCGHQCFPFDPHRVRYVSGSVHRQERLNRGRLPVGHLRIAPDLIVEVIAPEERSEILENRVADFIRAGVSLVWVVYPLTRNIRVDRRDGSGRRIGPDGVLDGEDVLPGFSCPLPELFSVIDGDPDPAA